MKILILSLVFPPDNVSTAHIVGRLAREFEAAGHDVVVLTSTPHYHPDDIEAWRRRLTQVFGRLVQRDRVGRTVVYHVWMPPKNRPLGARLLAWLWFHVATTLLGIGAGRGADVILGPSPPLTIGLEAWMLGAWHGAPFVYNVQEVHPDVAVALGAIRRPSIIRWLRALEDWVYAKAAYVTVIGSGMRANLLGKGVPSDKLVIIPNFVDPDELPVRPRDNAFAAAHGLLDRFVVSYAGNLGAPQGLSTVLEAAKLLETKTEIAFLLVGDGSAAGDLRRQAERDRLGNVRFLPFQPFSAVPDIYATSDASLVPQAEGTGLHGLPSKIYRIMACGRPIVGMCDADSEVAALIEESGCGVTVRPNDPRALAAAILAACDARTAWAAKGAKGRAFVEGQYSVRQVSGQYLELLERARSARAPRAAGRPPSRIA